MKNNILYIKNVVCQRCKISVREILSRLEIPFKEVSLGEAVLERKITEQDLVRIQKEFDQVGFEILLDRNERLVNRIKSIIIATVYKIENTESRRLSTILSERLHYDYSHLTHIFTKEEGMSIQKYQNKIKIERIKELLEYGELNVSQIAQEVGYNSAAYLSTQFKKATGKNPSQYRLLERKMRNDLDSL
ncbi:MAG TPA: helix-turn-helix transcriptional regulator [Salinimicrobium sp.]|nr:helix-turn-helix transcriptional regulator [Salinimicrobium sp.]